ncbi:MAG: acyl carrier protein [Oscillospiraceae bacterium]|jgi:acyl carrier protein|nr:acyl carrier protein [Oscillospiraceae bacterium]
MVFERIAAIIAEHLGCAADSISRASTFEDLGIDSLDTVEMVMQLEEELGTELEIESKLGTVGELVDFVESKL